jgi:phage protein D/phage baseplate assembly protein gpV
MPAPDSHTHGFQIEVEGTPLPDDVRAMLEAFVVDDSLHAPDLFELRFRDPNRAALEKGGFEIGKAVKIAVMGDANSVTLIEAEITAVEIGVDQYGTHTVVRGLDHSHRLLRGRRTESYRNMTYSDIAKKVATRAGLTVGQIDSTKTVHEHVCQPNVTDWQFLRSLAQEVGYEVAVVDKKFEFRKPTESQEAPGVSDMSTYGDALQLTLGTNLISLSFSLTSGGQVSAVKVRGWDWMAKKEVVGQAPAKTVHAQTEAGVTPEQLAAKFGQPEHVASDVPYTSVDQAEVAAKALAEQIASGFAELTAVARGHPQYRAGTAVSIGLAGSPFDGRYTLTRVEHWYTPEEGYLTNLAVSGRQDRSLYGLATGIATKADFGGVVTGIVTDARDPEKLGRVKLKFPWLSDTYETDWVRTVQASAGAQRGAWFVPEVNDEVLVAFDHGDVRWPYVVGGLYNGKDRPKQFVATDPIDSADGSVKARGLQSRTGHYLEFRDETANEAIVLASGDGSMRLEFLQKEKKIHLKATGCAITIETDRNLELKGQKVTITGATGVDIRGGPLVKVTAAQIKLN